jgi:hypothetical protein
MSLLTWLSTTGPAVWMRESESVWAYPTILFLHTLGLGILVGFTAAIDVRVLGFSEQLPLAPLSRFVRWAVLGFVINLLTGIMFFTGNPFQYINNVP